MPILDPSRWRDFNPYEILRPLLFRLDAEETHEMAIRLLKKGIAPHFRNDADTSLYSTVCGLDFPNPVGLAAGFDKQAEVMSELFGFGFGFVEVGGITPKPQPGNVRPRLFRVPEAEAIINRFGFNSDGYEVCLRRITAWYDALGGKHPGPLGIQIVRNKESPNDAADYLEGIRVFSPYADYLTVNISSPNTPGMRDLQKRELLDELLAQVMAARGACEKKPPIFVKLAPDLTEAEADSIAESVLAHKIDGLILTNTTVSRPGQLPAELAKEAGGLSGRPLFAKSTRVLAHFYKATGGKIPLIGVGGVFSAEDAYTKIKAGASLVQLYTALIYKGPLLVPRLNRDLSALLKRDGFRNVAEAVGSGNK